ncbi:hypothetical protein [Phenylobacterium sp.]|jgi:hypothetical membrane protein|uniref:hypothetical protein n=1 Tax=Phenylobacterium sp. TaxID=1871053 RepID=UPI002E35D836|nr:hypothetical protein [Phenylobacterium sp.]HEX4712717.1 hypothetical protein [Phenylobacterium sp.]
MTIGNTTILIAGLALTLVGIFGRRMQNVHLRYGLQFISLLGVLALIIVRWVESPR